MSLESIRASLDAARATQVEHEKFQHIRSAEAEIQELSEQNIPEAFEFVKELLELKGN